MHACKIYFDFGIKIACMQNNNHNLIILGERIKSLRVKKGLTLSGLAYQNSLEPSTLSRIEYGQVDAKFSTLVKIAYALDTTVEEIVKELDLQNL